MAGDAAKVNELDGGVPPIAMQAVSAANVRREPRKGSAAVAVVQEGARVGVLPVREGEWRLVWVVGWTHESLLR